MKTDNIPGILRELADDIERGRLGAINSAVLLLCSGRDTVVPLTMGAEMDDKMAVLMMGMGAMDLSENGRKTEALKHATRLVETVARDILGEAA